MPLHEHRGSEGDPDVGLLGQHLVGAPRVRDGALESPSAEDLHHDRQCGAEGWRLVTCCDAGDKETNHHLLGHGPVAAVSGLHASNSAIHGTLAFQLPLLVVTTCSEHYKL